MNDSNIAVDGHVISVYDFRDPAEIPRSADGSDIIEESTGAFKLKYKAFALFKGGSKKIVISVPTKDAPMFVVEVNDDKYTPNLYILCNASCTKNCLTPLAKLIRETFGTE